MLGFKLELPQREDGPTKKTRPIYLDMQVIEAVTFMMQPSDYAKATTPVDPRVLDAMLPYLTDQYGNPHSRTHAYGWEAEKGVEDARQVRYRPFTLHISYSYEYCQHIADLIGADPKDIIFTSGATETNNMAIKGVARFHKDKKRHVITTQTVSLVFFVLVTTPLILYRSTNAYSIRVESCRRRVLM
jgi:cysteine desulfurase